MKLARTLFHNNSSLSLHHTPGLGRLLKEVGHHGVLAVNGLDGRILFGGDIHNPDTICWSPVHAEWGLKQTLCSNVLNHLLPTRGSVTAGVQSYSSQRPLRYDRREENNQQHVVNCDPQTGSDPSQLNSSPFYCCSGLLHLKTRFLHVQNKWNDLNMTLLTRLGSGTGDCWKPWALLHRLSATCSLRGGEGRITVIVTFSSCVEAKGYGSEGSC